MVKRRDVDDLHPLNLSGLTQRCLFIATLVFGLLLAIDQAFSQTDTLWADLITPTNVDVGGNNPVELGVKFFSDVPGQVFAIRFYKGPTNTGTHTVQLWGASGLLLAEIASTNETAEGWQTVYLATPVTITAGTTYTASYHTQRNFADDKNYFTQEYSNGVLHAPVNAGVYIYGNRVRFPTNVFEASNYWVDVIFVPSQSPPPPPPPPPPVNGECGPSDGMSFSSAPTTGLCSAGTSTPVSGAGPWTWMCTGSNGGTTAACSALVSTTGGSFTWQSEYDVVDTVTVNGNSYVPELDTSKTWPPMEFATNVDTSTGALGDLWQFELHAGDVSNIGSERVELDGYHKIIPRDTEFWISYAVKVLPGQVIPFATTYWNILGQSHQGASSGSPDFYCWYLDDKFYLNVGNTNAPSANVDGQHDGTYFISPVLPRGVWHNVVYDVIKSSSGTGDKLVVWFDGVQVYSQSGATLMGEHTSGSYWKYGIYRAPGSGGPLPVEQVQFANVEVSTASLLSRVASPLPYPNPL